MDSSQAFQINPPLSDHSSFNDSMQTPSQCSKGPSHSTIQYFCLQSTCSSDRLLCRACIAASHRKHKVGIIDKLIEPLNRLNMNSYHTDSRQVYEFFNERLKGICEEWEKMNQLFYKNMLELQNGVMFQLSSIMKTFTDEEIDNAYMTLSNKNSPIQDVNEYIDMINFLQGNGHSAVMEEVGTLKGYAETVSERVKKIISKTVKKVEILLGKMQEHIKEIDFTKLNLLKDHPQQPAKTANNKQDDDEKGTATQTDKDDDVQERKTDDRGRLRQRERDYRSKEKERESNEKERKAKKESTIILNSIDTKSKSSFQKYRKE